VVDASIRYNIHLDASHFIYQAHFPDEPITPGVCIIQIAKELLEEHLGIGLEIQKVKNVKFLNVISPLATPNVTYVFEKIMPDDSEKTYKVMTQVSSGETSLAKLSFTCK
jgi:3-hydroxyacyl-[acyl-carrier-protein] dehydratase